MPFDTYHLGEHRDKIIKGTAPTARAAFYGLWERLWCWCCQPSPWRTSASPTPCQILAKFRQGQLPKVTKAEVLSLGALYTDSALQPNLPPHNTCCDCGLRALISKHYQST